jgi:hypothetical protein
MINCRFCPCLKMLPVEELRMLDVTGTVENDTLQCPSKFHESVTNAETRGYSC